MEQDAVIDTLNDLIQATEDSHLGLQRSAEDMKDEATKALLNDMAARRGAIVRDLQRTVAALGGAPEATGTLMGGARRMVAEVAAALGARSDPAILADTVAAQEATLSVYGRMLDLDLPEEVLEAMAGHQDRLREDRDRLAALNLPDQPAEPTRESA
ncbi:PA2169 family four-helix-bundle protein [Aerophototrophica crusticola]|uniref:PA2169 family four-helix-bundle protein n=1 Tax=Aerophototrophica crusticola TaxID=1709002 RepID=A0A858R9S9_9PROT|nr:PA2169 family four-helix-bundle protein [Rhodospirillaceae bacterium B3]